MVQKDSHNWKNNLGIEVVQFLNTWLTNHILKTDATFFKDRYRSLKSSNRITGLSNKPVMLAEIASAEGGGDKTAWLGEMFDQLASDYSRVEAMFWFDVDKECDWRINSSSAVLALFRSRAAGLFGATV